jgi:DNA polymerase-1
MIAALDTETTLFVPGRAVPRLVCWSYIQPAIKPYLLKPKEGCDLLEEYLDNGTVLALQHCPFDLAVAAEYRWDLLPKIFEALKAGRIRDTKVRQALIDLRIGRRKNPATKKKETFRGAPWPESTPGFGEWVPSDLTLAGNPERGTLGMIGLYFGKDRSAQKGTDSWRTRYAELDHLPLSEWPAEAVKYAEEDASDTLDVYLAQHALASKTTGLITGDDPETPLVDEVKQVRKAFALHLVSAWGVRTDGATIDELERRCLVKRAEIREKLMEFGLFRWEGTKKQPQRKIVKDTKAIQARVKAAFEAQGLPVPRGDVTPKMAEKGITEGNIKTDKDVLVLSDDPLLQELADAGPAATVLNTFIPALRQAVDVPSNTQFDTLLDNGRISSSRVNWNQLPRGETLQKLIQMDVRQAVIPRPGFVFCSVDYECAELRSHAQVNVWLHREYPDRIPFPEMAKFFQANPNGDPHLELAAGLLGLTSEEALAKKKAGDKEVKHYRQSAKPTNFGLPGGMGPPKLVESARKSYGVRMTLAEGRKQRAAWKKRWIEMGPYLEYISEMTSKGPWDLTQYVSKRIRGRAGYSDAANSLWSGLTADGAGHALSNVVEECYVDCGTALYGSRPILFVYDEVVCEVPIPIAHEAAARLTELMISSMQEYLPDVPVTASPALMTRWIKGAEERFDDEGMLIPWDWPEGKPSPYAA